MKADWDDAPLRVRRKESHKPLIIALLTGVGIGATTFAIMNLPMQTDRLTKAALPPLTIPERIEAPTINTVEVKQAAEAAKDIYLEQVNRMLTTGTEWGLCEAFKDGEGHLAESIRNQNCKPDPVAEKEWTEQQEKASEERQTVFTDANYTQPTATNTIRLPRPQPQQAQSTQRNQPYVTVVKETRDSCGFAKPGSVECRKIRAQIYQNYSRACLQGGDSQSISCRAARSYEPTR